MTTADGETPSSSGLPGDPFDTSSPPPPTAPETPSYPAAPIPGTASPADAFGAQPATPIGSPPPGYVAYGSAPAAQLESTGGLGTAVKILFWVCVGASALSSAAIFSRRGAWDDFVAGNASFSDLDTADGLVGAAGLLSIVLTVAAGIVVSIWALRAARNFQSLGTPDISPGWACGGWYIPIGNLFVPFIQLRKGVKATGGDTNPSVIWQTLWIASTVSGLVVRQAFDGNGRFVSDQQVSDQLTTQSTAAFVQTLLLAGAAFFAVRSISAINERFAATTNPAQPTPV